jgi:hypothetical protein
MGIKTLGMINISKSGPTQSTIGEAGGTCVPLADYSAMCQGHNFVEGAIIGEVLEKQLRPILFKTLVNEQPMLCMT